MIHVVLSVAAAMPSTSSATALDDDRLTGPVLNAPDRDAPTTQIINGETATKDDWPMAGGMILEGLVDFQGFELEQTTVLCSSTLIAPDVVLVAAHCLDLTALTLQFGGGVTINNPEFYWTQRRNLSDYQLGAAAQNLPADARRAIHTVRHEGFNLLGMQLGLSENDDIALMFLDEPVLDVPLGYLPQKDTDETKMEVGEEVVAVGWGQQIATAQGEAPPPGSYGVKMMGVSHIAEKSPYEFKVGEAQSDVRKCHGDSGGPSFKQVETDSTETWRVVGVTSHSYDFSDCNLTGGVDTRVSYYLEWIDEQMRSACADGTRSWCEIEGIIPPPAADGTVAWEIEPEEEAEAKGCNTASAAGIAGWASLGLLALMRRR